MASIELDSIGLTFRIRNGLPVTLKGWLLGLGDGRGMQTPTKVRAVRNVSLRIGEGERVGILGHNGSGKSTLLRMIAGVYPPTRGTRRVEGRIGVLFDLVAGFDPYATGWQNISLQSYLQGETPAGVRAKAPGIAEFTELGSFLDVPVRCYSAGMRVRLAFATATAMEPEILLVDEVLAVGDRAFQAKARDRMHELINRARLLVMVSHDLEALEGLCNRGIWLHQGQVRADGPMKQILDQYRAHSGASNKKAA